MKEFFNRLNFKKTGFFLFLFFLALTLSSCAKKTTTSQYAHIFPYSGWWSDKNPDPNPKNIKHIKDDGTYENFTCTRGIFTQLEGGTYIFANDEITMMSSISQSRSIYLWDEGRDTLTWVSSSNIVYFHVEDKDSACKD